jgi:type VI secretion system protein ImpG
MSESLFRYYQNELVYIRQLAQEFAKLYPDAAGRLVLEKTTGKSVDPHVERLIQAFALLTARVHHKLDDEFPELTDALLGVLYPHYLAPVPSMAVVEFLLDPGQAQLPNGFRIERHSRLRTQPVAGVPCKYRTGYPVTLWPVEVASARYQQPPFPGLKPPARTAAALRLQLDCRGGMTFAALALDQLLFYLSGESTLIPILYELLFNHTLAVVFRPLDKNTRQPPLELKPDECRSPVGFELDEGLLPYPNQSFLGYRLLTEFFAFPSKFLFFRLGGWERVRQAGFQERVEVVFFFDRNEPNLEPEVTAETFRLGCTPVVNLFEQYAEPIPLKHSQYEYRVVPDVTHPRGLETYSIDAVSSANQETGETFYQPFYSFRHGGGAEARRTFWYATRRPSMAKQRDTERDGDRSIDRGSDVYVHLVDLDFDPRRDLADSNLMVRTTCTNRDLPIQLQQAGNDLAFELETAAPLAGIRCPRVPSPPLRPPSGRLSYWRLVSHLCLNHLSIADGEEGREALQEILRLYDFADPVVGHHTSAVTRQLIDGIVSVSSRRTVARVGGPVAGGFAKGVEVGIEFDEEKYVGTGVGVYLFACMLERFLGLYASVNSFSQLVGKTKQREGYFKKWPPRAAQLPIL